MKKSNFFNVGVEVLFLVCCFVALVTSMADLEWRIIPDQMSYFLIVFGLIAAPFNALLKGSAGLERFFQSILGVLISGGTLLLISYVGQSIAAKEVMGLGDVKLLAGWGAVFGWAGALFVLAFAAMLGGLIAIFGLLIGRMRRGEYIPFGPFLNVSAISYFLLHLWYSGRPPMLWASL